MGLKEIISNIKKNSKPLKRKRFFYTKLLLKKFIIFGIIANVSYTFILIPFYNESHILLPMSRSISKFSGRMGNIKIPLIFRDNVYESYSFFYGVNKDEIVEPHLKNFKTIKEFFIREIDVNEINKKIKILVKKTPIRK